MSSRILVIDDELLILNTVEKALAKVGYNVIRAQNMSELDAALKEAPYDLLITDLHMEEESTENIIKKVEQSSPHLRVLLMSGSSNITKVDNFIEKPFTLEELRQKVKTYLE